MNEKTTDEGIKLPSLFKSFRDQNPTIITWEEIFHLITSGYFRESTEKYRYYLQQGMDKDTGKIKSSSYGITPAVACLGGRRMENITGYTLFSLADFDHVPAGELARCMRLLADDPHTFLAYITISGLGIRVIFRIDSVDDYAEAFRQGNEYFSALIGHPYDEKCKNPARLSGLCHDPAAIFHPGAQGVHIVLEPKPSGTPGRPRKVCHATAGKAAPVVLSLLKEQGKAYGQGHHNEFISCALYLMNDYGVPQQEATEWAQAGYPDFDTVELGGIARSVYLHTEEHGSLRLPSSKDKPSKRVSVEELEAFIASQAEIRHNTVLDRREICWKGKKIFRDITDSDENTLWLRACKNGLYSNQRTFLSILKSEFVPSYNPLTDYLKNLPPWDGVTDYIAQVSALVHTSDDYLFGIYFRKWFVALIAGIKNTEVVNHTILVLLGKQGIYKTTFFNKLLPPSLQRYFHTKTNSGQMTKDDNFSLAESVLLCIEEIDNMRPAELNRLKAMVTMTSVNERAAYDRNKSFRNHIASFCATGNNKLFLTDDSGNRRWLPFWVHSIANMYACKIPYDGLYAQALSLYDSPFQYWFTDGEMDLLNRHNRDFEEPNIEEELILSRFRKPVAGETGIFMSTPMSWNASAC